MHHRDALGLQQLGDEILVGAIVLPDGALLPIAPAQEG